MLPVSDSSRWWTRNASCSSGRPPAGHRVEEPVRVRAVRSRCTPSTAPRPGQHRVRGGDQPRRAASGGDQLAGRRRQRGWRTRASGLARPGGRPVASPRGAPGGGPSGVAGPRRRRVPTTSAGDIRRSRRRYHPAEAAVTRSPGRRVARLSSTASVARVVATSESSAIGIGPPVRTAVGEPRPSCARWPLSGPAARAWPPCPGGDHDGHRWKLSSSARCGPRRSTSSVSLGKRGLPPVT